MCRGIVHPSLESVESGIINVISMANRENVYITNLYIDEASFELIKPKLDKDNKITSPYGNHIEIGIQR
jgi:hypothetical protein